MFSPGLNKVKTMAKEKRHILFSEHEVRRALLACATTRGCPYNLEDHKPELSQDDRGEVTAQLVKGDLPSVSFSNSELLSAMIVFCKRAYIPLPRLSTKELEIHGGALVMAIGDMTMNSMLASVSQRLNALGSF